jgi:hypothetical protein
VQGNFKLWLDAYDLVNCEETAGKEVWLKLSIGGYTSAKFAAKYKSSTQSYTWPKISLKELQVSLPSDRTQIPDVFVNFYSQKTFSGEYRFGYVRIPARELMKDDPSP